ncbi:MAG: bifunctional folylpolyglutamate synthase/dihydrofolate synthase [Pyrinomonadaceae bacterium MAG19_C2-C3]|nr:bifunctional folylpolyglutamate synthase/dihydrofolate synthase [Pyrinomonadaceae bacterium MAG19_C2-C3]
MNFSEAKQYLLSLGHETLVMKFGLDGIRRLLRELGNPHESFYKIQIAGTNGKGSTAAMLDSITRAAGIRTGLYTSPHLVSITERIRIDGADISPEAFAHATTLVRDAAERLAHRGNTLPTFFEQITAVACVAFREGKIDLAILETGLGGRFDAVTATRAALIGITPIALDHQEYLGTTITEIAREKAAVMRLDTKAVIAPQIAEARDAIAEHVASINVEPLYLTAQNAHVTDVDERGRLTANITTRRQTYRDLFINLAGRHQLANAQVAVELAETLRSENFFISDDAIRFGLGSTRHAGRLEWHTPSSPGAASILFDGAHNTAGAQALADYLREFVHTPLTIISGAMRDKDLAGIAASLFPLAHHLILTQPDNPRAAHVDSLLNLALTHLPASRISVCPTVNQALRLAQNLTGRADVVCVTGSLYLIGEVKNLLDA